jgi:phosphate transport system protein
MGRLLEDQIHHAVKALVDKDVDLVIQLLLKMRSSIPWRWEIERKSLSLIALKQPIGQGYTIDWTCLRIIVDIERMADHAEDIAQIAVKLHDQTYINL